MFSAKSRTFGVCLAFSLWLGWVLASLADDVATPSSGAGAPDQVWFHGGIANAE